MRLKIDFDFKGCDLSELTVDFTGSKVVSELVLDFESEVGSWDRS